MGADICGNSYFWGVLAVIDLYGCDPVIMKSKNELEDILKKLVDKIEMKSYGKPQIYRFGQDSLEGLTAIQLIETSSITIHCDEEKKRVFVDIFSCKSFDCEVASNFLSVVFGAQDYSMRVMARGTMDFVESANNMELICLKKKQ